MLKMVIALLQDCAAAPIPPSAVDEAGAAAPGSAAGRPVGGRALRGRVDLLRREQRERADRSLAGCAHGDADGRRRFVIGKVADDERVVAPESEVEALDRSADALGQLFDGRATPGSTLAEHTLEPLGRVVRDEEILRHDQLPSRSPRGDHSQAERIAGGRRCRHSLSTPFGSSGVALVMPLRSPATVPVPWRRRREIMRTHRPSGTRTGALALIIALALAACSGDDAASTARTLRAPDGAIYVLYLLTLGGEIGSLADDLVLADGWTYAPRALTEPLVVDSGGSVSYTHL